MKGSRCIIRRVDLVRCLITSNVYNSGYNELKIRKPNQFKKALPVDEVSKIVE